ncbi:MAG: DJ-1/PfpI family protein [Candidatus Rifleibacteriota bacterium]
MNKIALIIMVLVVSFAGIVSAADSIEITPVKFEEVDAGMAYNVEKVPVENPESMVGAKIAIVAAHGFEEIEALYPIDYFLSRGAEVEIIAPDWIKDRVMAVKFLKPSVWIPVTKNISQAVATDYCAVVIPGGAWNPIIMRTDQQIITFIQAAQKANKLIAAVCHGPQVLISADLVKGRMITGVGDIRVDLANAGGEVVHDQPVVVDGNILTSRDPNDMAEFSKGIEAYLKKNLAFCKSQEKDAAAGLSVEASMQKSGSWETVCEVCKGTGRLYGGPGYYPYNCPTCKGTGRVHTHKPPVSTDH